MAQIIAIISSISTAIGIVKKLSSEDKDAKILSNITLMGYMIFICIVSFNPYQGVVVGLKTMGACYVLGIMVILICKLWLRTEGVHKWVYIGVLVTLFTMALDIYSYKADKNQLLASTFEDEKLAQIHKHIITAHEQLIIGYEGLLAWMEKEDYDQILKFQGILLTSQDSMDKWNELLDARECQ